MTRLKQCLLIGGLVFLLSGSAGPFAWDLYWHVHLPIVYGARHYLTCGQATTGYPDALHYRYYYYLQLEETSTITVSVEQYEPTSLNGNLLLYGPEGGEPWSLIMHYGEPDNRRSMFLGPCSLEQGTYLVWVHTDKDHYSTTPYTLTVDCVSFDADPESPCTL